ncbi:RND family transporter [Halieaceae bacterium IMCC14734]|uniref:RND family transporter n=1 Tax=Candidatus Litorirhabdus singularis TaxID=2518993 RepID=A0ABT3TLA4_9GAMM|nr:MMPL family transporter [Candidatus Litorirhabdus singularis]MCX2983098.1 RND family transporter [Candidatus Litorirhabdus singularis]
MSSTVAALYERLVLRHPLISLVLCALVIGALASQLGNLKLDASSDSLVLEGDADLQFFRDVAKEYESEEFLVITYRPGGDLLGDESLATIGGLRDELVQLDGVSSVLTILDVPLLQSPPVSLSDVTGSDGMPTLEDPGIDRELVREEFRTSPIYHQLLVSPDGTTAAIQVNLEPDEKYRELLQRREDLRSKRADAGLDQSEQEELSRVEKEFKAYSSLVSERQSQLVETVRQVVAPYRAGADLFVGGVPMIAADMVSFVRSDLVTFGSGILLFVVVVLAIIFRQPRFVLIPMITCIATATFMLGLLATLDWRMTVISSNFVALLLITTLAITIHLMVRYRELQLDNPDTSQFQLVMDTVRLMAIPCLYTSLTTAVAFVSLVVSGLRPVMDFGWMMTVGLGVALVLTFIILPCLMVLLPKGRPANSDSRHSGLTVYFAGVTEKRGGAIIAVALLMLCVSVAGISQLKVENRFIDYFSDTTEIYQGMELLDAQLGGTIPLDIIIDLEEEEDFVPPPMVIEERTASAADTAADAAFEDEFEDEWADDWEDDSGFDESPGGESFQQSYWFTVRGMEKLEAIHNYIDSLPETGKVLSLATTYAVVKNLLGEDVGDVELALVQKSLPADIAEIVVDPYYSESLDQARISLRVKETSQELRRNQFLIDLRQHLVEDMGLQPDKVRFTGMLVLYNNVLQSLFKSQILTLGAVFIAILIMFLVLFRSLWLALIAIGPNLLAAGIVLGGMGIAGIPLDIMTITIAAIVVGIGVDHAIHYVHRFKREFPLDRNYVATMYRCHESIGRAMYYTSITVIVGFSILALSNFTPSIYFGLLTGLAMFASVLGSLMLLPKLIILFKPLGPQS